MDADGLLKTSKPNGTNYFILFVDNYIRTCWVYLMKQSSEVADVFDKFKPLVENQVMSAHA